MSNGLVDFRSPCSTATLPQAISSTPPVVGCLLKRSTPLVRHDGNGVGATKSVHEQTQLTSAEESESASLCGVMFHGSTSTEGGAMFANQDVPSLEDGISL